MTPVLTLAEASPPAALAIPLVLELAQAAGGERALASHEIAVDALLPAGASRYDPRRQELVPVASRDLRALAGPDTLASAGLGLVYVADLVRMQVHAEDHGACAGPDVRRMAAKVAQHCAALGLAS